MHLPDTQSRGSRAPALRLRTIPLAAAALAATAAIGAAQMTTTTETLYTTTADFQQGTLVNVNADMPPDQLQLNEVQGEMPFLFVPASGRGTILRVDATTGDILGEYMSAPEPNEDDPSRTSVDSAGNCWAVNRAEDTLGLFGTAVKIGIVIGGTRTDASGSPDPTGGYLAPPFIYSTAEDRDGDGLIRTSMGLGDVLAWDDPNDGGMGGGPANGLSAEDECILLYQRTDCTNMRHVSIDANDDVWVGGYPQFQPNCFQRLASTDGQILETVVTVGACGGFSGIVDSAGTLWSSSPSQGSVMRYVPGSGGPVDCLAAGTGPSGIAEDSSGVIWVGGGDELRRFDPSGAEIMPTYTVPGAGGIRHVTVTADDDVWAASFDTNQVYRVDQSGSVVATIATGQTPNGLSVDSLGYVWVVNLEDDNVQRIDPATNAVDMTVSLGAGALPFNPSQFTGSLNVGGLLRMGDWTVTQEGSENDADWTRIAWTSEELSGSLIEVFARAANSMADLPNETYVQVTNGADPMLMGRFIQVQARFDKAPSMEVSPVLFDLTIDQTTETTDMGDCETYNRRHAGSLLLYPEFDNRDGVVSVLTITDVDCAGEDVDVEFVYIDETDCEEFNRTDRLTPCDTLTVITNFHNPEDEQGYVYAFAKDPLTGQPTKHDSLTGHLLILSGLEAFEYAVNPLVFAASVDSGPTDLDGDGVRDLDGEEYEMAPDEILVPRFLGQGQVPRANGGVGESELILIGLTGGQEFTTRVDFLIYNDNEEVFSSEYEFYCWDKPSLLDISGVFANDFLQNWTDDDPDEILGAGGLESGWMRIDGAVAASTAVSIADPAFYAVLVERIGSFAAADLPFELCSQDNGDLLPSGVQGDQ
jgi:hypothetical protein